MTSTILSRLSVGQTVYFKPGPDFGGGWIPMRITYVGNESLNGITMPANGSMSNSNFRDGVVYHEDPRLQDPQFVSRLIEDGDQGIFKLAPWDEQRDAFEEHVMSQLKALNAKLDKASK